MPLHRKHILLFLILSCSMAFAGCNFRCLFVPSCFFTPATAPKLSKNRYYEKHFTRTDTLLSTEFFYRITDTIIGDKNNIHPYRNRAFLFYPNGLVLEEDYYTGNPDRDTLFTYTDDLKFACCHAWTVGSYKISNDTVYFATKSGNMEYWTYYRAKIFKDSIRVFEKKTGDQKDNTTENFPKRTGQVVIKNINVR